MSYHKDEVGSSLHIANAFTYANIAAMNAASLLSTDVGKIAAVGATAPYSYYVLVNASPVTWKLVNSLNTTKGDLTSINSAGNPSKLVVGVNGSVLTADSSQTTGLGWVVGTPVLPTGVMVPFGGTSAPVSWYMCDGSVQSQTDPVFAALFAVINSAYNTGGEGAGNFRLPASAGRTFMGAGTYTDPVSGSITRTVGQKLGAEKHQLSTAELATHSHGFQFIPASADVTLTASNYLGENAGGGLSLGHAVASTTTNTVIVGDAGSNTPHNNMQPSLGCNFIIKL